MSDFKEVQVGRVVVTTIRREPESGFGSRKRAFHGPILEVWTEDGERIAADCRFADFRERYWMDECDVLSLKLERAKAEIARLKKKAGSNAR